MSRPRKLCPAASTGRSTPRFLVMGHFDCKPCVCSYIMDYRDVIPWEPVRSHFYASATLRTSELLPCGCTSECTAKGKPLSVTQERHCRSFVSVVFVATADMSATEVMLIEVRSDCHVPGKSPHHLEQTGSGIPPGDRKS
jgi:hypothetical protein